MIKRSIFKHSQSLIFVNWKTFVEKNSDISSLSDHHGNGVSDDSGDKDDKDDENLSSIISDQISELFLKFNKDDAINAVRRNIYFYPDEI